MCQVKDIGHCEEEFPFQIEDRRSPEMASYPRSERVVVQPRAVRPSPVGHFTTYLPPHPTPFPYYVGDGGAVLYPVNSGYFSSVRLLPSYQALLGPENSSIPAPICPSNRSPWPGWTPPTPSQRYESSGRRGRIYPRGKEANCDFLHLNTSIEL